MQFPQSESRSIELLGLSLPYSSQHKVVGEEFTPNFEDTDIFLRQLGVAVLIDAGNGRYLLHQRDNISSISFPNYWSVFTGGVEESDWTGNLASTMHRAAVRELGEELHESGRPYEPLQLRLLQEMYTPTHARMTWVTSLRYPLENLELKEGQDLGTFSAQDVGDIDIVPHFDRLILEYDGVKRGLERLLA